MHGIVATIVGAVTDPDQLSTTVNTSFAGVSDQMWLVIPGGLVIFGILFGLVKAKKAGKTAAA